MGSGGISVRGTARSRRCGHCAGQSVDDELKMVETGKVNQGRGMSSAGPLVLRRVHMDQAEESFKHSQ